MAEKTMNFDENAVCLRGRTLFGEVAGNAKVYHLVGSQHAHTNGGAYLCCGGTH